MRLLIMFYKSLRHIGKYRWCWFSLDDGSEFYGVVTEEQYRIIIKEQL